MEEVEIKIETLIDSPINSMRKFPAYIFILSVLLVIYACGSGDGDGSAHTTITLDFLRIEQPGLDPFTVRASVSEDGSPVTGAALEVTVTRGDVSPITETGAGVFEFTVTPSVTGIYPVTVSYNGASVRRDALVLPTMLAGTGQPLLVPGEVNTEGYEDGITITPDGRYLFIQYGPLYFSGVFSHAAICADVGWSMYNLENCPGKDDSEWVFDTIGPYGTSCRPGFPEGVISGGKLTHLDITLPGVANKIALFPTVFYGFKRQIDGSFREPFRVAFDDEKGANGPFGLSFRMTGDDTAEFIFAWNNYFNDLDDDKPDIYHGTITMGQDTSLGDVTYAGEFFDSITPNVSPVGFTSHAGVQGNPHLYYDTGGTVRSIWTDDEQDSHDLTVYVLTSGSFPAGTWTPVNLPLKINTAASESQPFFTGTRLYMNREVRIVYHEYTGTHDAAGYADNANWGDEVIVLGSGDTSIGGIFGVGEPTIATFEGKTWLYFVYVENRSKSTVTSRIDYDLGAAFVELP